MLLFELFILLHCTNAILPVQENEIREARSLDGLWTFVRDVHNGADYGMKGEWYKQDLYKFSDATVMPVPSAYNDISSDVNLRDHVGWVWYERRESIPQRHSDSRVFIRADSANYFAVVYINSIEVGRHVGGHLPFEFEITKQIKYGMENKITIAVNNTLSFSTIPNGDFKYYSKSDIIANKTVPRYPEGFFQMKGNMDFFHYAGLLRPVRILFRPSVFIANQLITAHANGSLQYSHQLSSFGAVKGTVRVFDPNGVAVLVTPFLNNSVIVPNAKLWWPRGMGAPNLYTITVTLSDRDSNIVDVIRTTFGFRSVTWDSDEIFINSKKFYCQGFGAHEEADIRGRSYDAVLMTKDLNNLEWIGANCYRTSHYPYAEERIFESDRRGIAVILETPAVGLKVFSREVTQLHEEMVREMIGRDRNHPSVIMWSMANEPHSADKEAREHFRSVINVARSLDTTRPITTVYGPSYSHNDVTADLLDVICVNRYYGWYVDIGCLQQISTSLYNDLTSWKEMFNRPVLLTEYGSESIPGLHQEPSFVFTEDYQVDLYRQTHSAIDRLVQEKKLAGELVWVYADFMTAQDITRVVGNHKGLFTRQRQPKRSAFYLKERYLRRLDQRDLLSPTQLTIHSIEGTLSKEEKLPKRIELL